MNWFDVAVGLGVGALMVLSRRHAVRAPVSFRSLAMSVHYGLFAVAVLLAVTF